jgi:DNA (cytosine-5)-methyltransferase 1
MLQHTYKPNAIHSDPRKPLQGCITTRSGDTDTHPYEKRSFNMAELAALNGFPPYHKFPPKLGVTALRELIGNAVPALSFEPFFRKVVEALKYTDEENEQYEQTEGRGYVD